MSHDSCVAVLALASVGVCAAGILFGWSLARLRTSRPTRRQGEIRAPGLLYIDRDKAVTKHIDSLRRMVRPGNRPPPYNAGGHR